MILFQYFVRRSRGLWLLALVALLGIAPQCGSPLPPLPATPSGPVHQVALLTPTSGELNTIGRVVRNGITLAFDEWNHQGGVLGHRLEGVTYNTDCTFETAQQATQQAIDDGFRFIIGPICSEAAIAAAALAEAAGVVMIAPAATHPLVTTNYQGQTRSTIFRTSYSYDWQGRAAARFAQNTLDVDRVALLANPTDSYTTDLVDAFAQEFSAGGGQIVYQGTYTPGQTDFTEILTAIEQAGAELIYLPADHTVANQVAGHLNELGLSRSWSSSETGLSLLGSDAWESAALDLTATAGSYFPVHFVPDNDRPSVQRWTETYKSIYATQPNTLAALGYDSANLLVNAIEQANTLEPASVAKVLQQVTYDGVTGRTSFDSQHNPIKSVPFLQVQDGSTRYISSVEP